MQLSVVTDKNFINFSETKYSINIPTKSRSFLRAVASWEAYFWYTRGSKCFSSVKLI